MIVLISSFFLKCWEDNYRALGKSFDMDRFYYNDRDKHKLFVKMGIVRNGKVQICAKFVTWSVSHG